MLKNSKCKDCGISFIPNAQFETRCFKCKTIKFNEQKAKYCKNQQKALVNRSQKPQKPLKPKIDEEQARINKIVRERDAGKPCISCGVIGKTLEAGHFISKNKCKALRYDKRNIHGQCLNCNRILHGNYAGYRLGLISRFSIEYVEILEEIERNERKIIEKFT